MIKIDTVGPTASAASASPSPTNHGPTFIATVSDVGSGGTNISAAEFFVDSVAADGSGTAMAATDGSYSGPSEAVTATMTVGQFDALSEGLHTIYIHGQDAAGNWGVTASTTFVKDTVAPASADHAGSRHGQRFGKFRASTT